MPDPKTSLANLLFYSGFLRLVQRRQPNTLTVLNYHRVDNYDLESEDTFKPNISATPQNFEQQMVLLGKWFTPISLVQINAFLQGTERLPPYAALITFDDGYLDNYIHAQPILERYQFSAVIYLTTEHIGRDKPFFWDLVAYCFKHTQLNQLQQPGLGNLQWDDVAERDAVVQKFTTWLKQLPDNKKREIVFGLPEKMGADYPPGKFEQIMMNWDQVRELSAQQIDFGGHTMTHPILTRISLDQARREINGSKQRIEAEISKIVSSFAYPNGGIGDFTPDIQQIVAEAGYQTAFTLINGKNSFTNIQHNPFAIRRIFISHKDSLPRFAAKISGISK